MSLLTVGTMAFDAIETPFGKTDKIIGGAATYISLSASYFIPHTQVVSIVGQDFPVSFMNDLSSKGIDLRGVEIVPNGKSFFWSGKYHNDLNSRDTLETQLNVLADFNPILPDSYKNTPYLLLGNLTPSVQKSVISQMEIRPKLIAMDTMNFWMDIALNELLETIKLVDILIINDEEARQLSGQYSLVKAARTILSLGPKYLVIKKGEHGALLFNGDEVFYAPALPLEEVFDPTGAGDTFAGGFMGYMARSKSISFDTMKRAVIYGSALASFCVEKFGTERLLELSKSEINNRLGKFVELVKFDNSHVEDLI